MSYEIHLHIAEDSQSGHLIASLAAEEHISPTEAVEKIINGVAGGKVVPNRKLGRSRIPGLPEVPLSSQDAAIVDEAMEIVMSARRERSERMFGA